MAVQDFTQYDSRRSLTPRKYQPKTLNGQHAEIGRLLVLGYSNVEVAQMLNCSTVTVSIVKNTVLGREFIQQLSAEADHDTVAVSVAIKKMAGEAAQVVRDIMLNEGAAESVRLKAAQDILDRNGFAAPKRLDITKTDRSLRESDYEELKALAARKLMDEGLLDLTNVIDVGEGAYVN